MSNPTIPLFLEEGNQKSFVTAAHWPGWSRGGKSPEKAIQSMLASTPKYAAVLERAEIPFEPPSTFDQFTVIEKQPGDATTNFGAPSIIFQGDQAPLTEAEFVQSLSILEASWKTFDLAAAKAVGKQLRLGPRGGGRDLQRILDHILDGDQSYLPRVVWKHKRDKNADPFEEINRMRETVRNAINQAYINGLPEKGPRGGKVWPLRFYVRRVIWHILDHAWEIEERIINGD